MSDCFDVVLMECFDVQEASYDYMEKEGERMFLECLDQLEVANPNEVSLARLRPLTPPLPGPSVPLS